MASAWPGRRGCRLAVTPVRSPVAGRGAVVANAVEEWVVGRENAERP
jgi:hypothetical protein